MGIFSVLVLARTSLSEILILILFVIAGGSIIFFILSKLFKFEPRNYLTSLKTSAFISIISFVWLWLWILYTSTYPPEEIYIVTAPLRVFLYFIPFLILYVLEAFSFLLITKKFYHVQEWYKSFITFVLYLTFFIYLFVLFTGTIPI